ncbi:YdcH family protein [Uliginosibacterium gangwonense]|uniref:YdcH family protein n=1 Tax=Uliginosibacterium gangwonense TaxID=392736 RepID=UPI0003615DA6|nr:YdcH family protein [Uliginosibacterium gangwonense]
MNEILESAMSLHQRLKNLHAEHQELEKTINQLYKLQQDDDLTLRRLKKRKLIVKDRINLIERMIQPETLA